AAILTFGISPDGKRITSSNWEQVGSLILADHVPLGIQGQIGGARTPGGRRGPGGGFRVMNAVVQQNHHTRPGSSCSQQYGSEAAKSLLVASCLQERYTVRQFAQPSPGCRRRAGGESRDLGTGLELRLYTTLAAYTTDRLCTRWPPRHQPE